MPATREEGRRLTTSEQIRETASTPATQVGEARVVSVGLERGRDDQGRATGPHGERGSKGASEEVEVVEAGEQSKGEKRCEERAEVGEGKLSNNGK